MIRELLLISTLLVPNLQNKSTPEHPLVLFETVKRAVSSRPIMIGEFIDGRGQVRYFNANDKKHGFKTGDWSNGKWDSACQCSVLTPAEVEKNLRFSDSVVCTVNKDTLAKYVHFLSLLVESKRPYSNKEHTVVGGGISAFYGYIYDKKRNVYKQILIEQHGDIEQHNVSMYITFFAHWRWCR